VINLCGASVTERLFRERKTPSDANAEGDHNCHYAGRERNGSHAIPESIENEIPRSREKRWDREKKMSARDGKLIRICG